MREPVNGAQKVGGALGPTSCQPGAGTGDTDRPRGHTGGQLDPGLKQPEASTPASPRRRGGARMPPGFRP